MRVLRIVIAVVVIASAPATAWAQRVTKVPDGDTVVIDGVGKVHLLGIQSADQPVVQLGPGGPLRQRAGTLRARQPPRVGTSISRARVRRESFCERLPS